VRRVTGQGFTLVELLISLALLGIVLTAVISINIGTSQSAAALQVRNDLTPELQIAQSYMAGKLGQAAYVFPVGANVQMTATANTAVSPSGSTNFKVGTDPVIAFVLPPKIVGTTASTKCSTVTVALKSDYCYTFYAFYAMKRSNYISAVSGADDSGANPANDSTAWVLMEYRGVYSDPNASYMATGFSQFVTEIPTGNRGRLLMDYLVPYPTTSALPLFSTNVTQTPPGSQQAGVATVSMNLAASQVVANQTVRVPTSNSTAFTSVTVYPRNVGKPMLDN